MITTVALLGVASRAAGGVNSNCLVASWALQGYYKQGFSCQKAATQPIRKTTPTTTSIRVASRYWSGYKYWLIRHHGRQREYGPQTKINIKNVQVLYT
jgi:hypothetical protein